MELTQPPVTAAQLQAAQYDTHIAPSTVFGGGLGVFTSLPVHPYQILGVLGGTIATQASSQNETLPHPPDRTYTLPPPWQGIIKGTSLCHASYVNHSETPNAELVQLEHTPILVLRALHYLVNEEEIFLQYSTWRTVPTSHPQYVALPSRIDDIILPQTTHIPIVVTAQPAPQQGPLTRHAIKNLPIPLPPPPPTEGAALLGRRMVKYFKKHKHNRAGWYRGTVSTYSTDTQYWRVDYDDGDEEDFSWTELEHRMTRKRPVEPSHLVIEDTDKDNTATPPRKRGKTPHKKRKIPPSLSPYEVPQVQKRHQCPPEHDTHTHPEASGLPREGVG